MTTAAKRITPTPDNGGSGAGGNLARNIDSEIENLWLCAPEWLANVAGTANAITATSDTAVVSANLVISRPKSYWLVPALTNTGATTITVDGITKSIVTASGNALGGGELFAGRLHLLVSDGTNLRIAVSGANVTGTNVSLNGGRLTNTTGVPTLGSPQTAKTDMRWAPDSNNQISLPDGSGGWTVVTSAEVLVKTTDTQNGNTHNGTRVIDGLTDTSQFVPNMKVSGTGVGGGAVISTIDSPTQVTVSVNSTASATVAVTFKCPADTGYDMGGKLISGALKLFMVARSSILNQNAMVKISGIDVFNSDNNMRWLGAFITSATDGQVDWTINGQRRFRIWNHDNRKCLRNVEGFSASGTWFKCMGLVMGTADVRAPGGGSGGLGNSSGTGGAGGTTSFGAHVSATGGAGSAAATGSVPMSNTLPAVGNGSSGDINIPGGGYEGGAPSVLYDGTPTAWYTQRGAAGGRGIRTRAAADLGASETVTCGAVGAAGSGAGSPGQAGNPSKIIGTVEVAEIVEY